MQEEAVNAGDLEDPAGFSAQIGDGHGYALILGHFLECNQKSEAGAVDEVEPGCIHGNRFENALGSKFLVDKTGFLLKNRERCRGKLHR